MCESRHRRGAWQDSEEEAWRLWNATTQRAAWSVKHRRHTAAEIYWRSAFDIALVHLEPSGAGLFSPLHLLEPLQGLVNLLLEQGRSGAAHSLLNEVADFLHRKGFTLTTLAERLLNAIAVRVAQAQRGHSTQSPAANNVDALSRTTHSGRRFRHLRLTETRQTAGSAG